MSPQSLESRILRFVAGTLADPDEPIAVHTRLAEDLGVDGSDAREFLREFADEFSVDTSAFVFDDYFGPEALDPVAEFVRLVKRKKFRRSITVGDLVRAAEEGRLV
jgi:acyl carrier protein